MFDWHLVIFLVITINGHATITLDEDYASRPQSDFAVCEKRRDTFNDAISIDGKDRFAVCRKTIKDNH